MVTTVFVVLMMVSCQREANNEVLMLEQNQAQAFSDELGLTTNNASTYHLSPALNEYTPYSSSSVTLPGSNGCGQAFGGVLRARVVSQNNNVFLVEVSKQDLSNFGAGTLEIRAASICGGIAGTQVVQQNTAQSTVLVAISATFAQGLTHFYPVFHSNNGNRYYASPFIVYTIPTYTMSYSNGYTMGTVNGVAVRSSGTRNQNTNSYYQCTEFCERYYRQVYNLSFSRSVWGHATNWINNLDERFLKYANGEEAPRVGDIVCFGGGTSNLGHVAIITEVSDNQVKLAQQNAGSGGHLGQFAPIGGYLTRNQNSLSLAYGNSLYVKGLIRKK